jgi:PAS domain S-box-containing protein
VAWLGLGTAAIALIALTAGLVLRLERQSFVNLQHTYGLAINLRDVLSDLEESEARERGYLLTGGPSYLEAFNNSRKALDQVFDRLRDLAKNNPKEQQQVASLRHLVHQKLDELQATIDTRAAAGLEAARAMVLTRQGEQLTDAIRQDIIGMEEEKQTTLARLSQEFQSRLRTGLAALVGSVLMAVCCLLVGQDWLARNASQRQRAEEELHVSESRFETLCEQAPLGIYETDAEGRCVYTNRRWSTMSGLSASESLGHGWARVLHPDDRATVFQGWQAAAQRGATWEYRLLTTQGETRWIRAVGGPIYSDQGALTGYVGTLEDVTERKRAMQSLQESEALNRSVLNSLPANIAILKANGKIQAVNEAWQRFAQANGDPAACSVDSRADYLEVCKQAAADGSLDAQKALAGIEEVLGGRRTSFEMQYPCHSPAEKRWFHMLVTPLDGAVGGGVVIAHVNITARKQAEQRFRLVVEAAPSGMVMVDRDGKIVLVNSRTEKLFGYERKELLGQSIEMLVPESARESHVGLRTEYFVRPLARPMGIGRDLYGRRKDGTQFPVEIGLNPIETEEGTWVLSSIVDVTERKRAEATLRESEERFRNMADTAPVMIWVSSPDKLCTFFNRVWLEFTGRAMEQELGEGWAESVHPDDLDRCFVTYSASFDARRRYRMEYRLRRADGEYRWVLGDGAPRFTSGGIFAGYIGSCIDITERRRAEEERQKFVSLADRSLEFVGLCDLDFRPFYINTAGLRLVGLDNIEAACQIKVQDYFFPEDQPFITNEFFPRVLRDGYGKVEIRFRHFKTGEAIWMIYNVFSICDAPGATVGWATVSVNITERRRAEHALQQSRQELRALAGRLINADEEARKTISRELHDDLSQKLALLAFDTSSLVLSPPPSVEEMKEPLRNLQNRVVQLSQDVRQISHQLHPTILEDLGLTAALSELCDEFSVREGIQVAFEQEAMPKALPVELASCLYRVVQEALHNVSKHARASQVRLKASGSPEGIHLSIHDTGVGFDSEAGLSQHGLGIVSMKERVQLVQGEFSIHSKPGRGTEVTVFVPLSKEIG